MVAVLAVSMPRSLAVARRADQPAGNPYRAGKSALGRRSQVAVALMVSKGNVTVFCKKVNYMQGESDHETETETTGEEASALLALRQDYVD
jgi:hypothetical protein